MAIEIRKLEESDLFNGFIELLSELSPVNLKFKQSLIEVFNKVTSNPNFCCWVVSDFNELMEKRIIGTASVLIEQKFGHGGGKVAHIEDVVVASHYRGQGVGRLLCEAAIDYARSKGCYKVLLNCATHNIEFYKKAGFKEHEVSMRLDLFKEL